MPNYFIYIMRRFFYVCDLSFVFLDLGNNFTTHLDRNSL